MAGGLAAEAGSSRAATAAAEAEAGSKTAGAAGAAAEAGAAAAAAAAEAWRRGSVNCSSGRQGSEEGLKATGQAAAGPAEAGAAARQQTLKSGVQQMHRLSAAAVAAWTLLCKPRGSGLGFRPLRSPDLRCASAKVHTEPVTRCAICGRRTVCTLYVPTICKSARSSTTPSMSCCTRGRPSDELTSVRDACVA